MLKHSQNIKIVKYICNNLLMVGSLQLFYVQQQILKLNMESL